MRDIRELEFREGTGASPGSIAAVETALGVQLPQQFKEIALLVDQGSPEAGIFPYGRVGESGISEFLPIADLPRYKKVSGRGLVPVARDAGDNLVCLDYSVGPDPAVVYLDHESGEISPVAPSFGEFVELLHE